MAAELAESGEPQTTAVAPEPGLSDLLDAPDPADDEPADAVSRGRRGARRPATRRRKAEPAEQVGQVAERSVAGQPLADVPTSGPGSQQWIQDIERRLADTVARFGDLERSAAAQRAAEAEDRALIEQRLVDVQRRAEVDIAAEATRRAEVEQRLTEVLEQLEQERASARDEALNGAGLLRAQLEAQQAEFAEMLDHERTAAQEMLHTATEQRGAQAHRADQAEQLLTQAQQQLSH
ncbi:MAG: hypothetical protein JWP39_821, partial [Jatrophihabitans sp.]|nr:hypothetical protein [Jatrophihabitans sp.]